MERINCLVIGAGAIGLAIASKLSSSIRDVLVVEKESIFGSHSSSRNNEVIHASLYHHPESPQAILCSSGRELIYDFCKKYHVNFKQVGKLIAATEERYVPWLKGVKENAYLNDVPGLEIISGKKAQDIEPNLECEAALVSPRSGIIDTHQLMLAYIGIGEANGFSISYKTKVLSIIPISNGFRVDFETDDNEIIQLECDILINSGGLWADDIANRIEGFPKELIPKVHYAWGAFYTYKGKAPFKHLIVPEPDNWRNGGIYTMDLGGGSKFGPDEFWVKEIDYGIKNLDMDHVYNSVRSYFKLLPENSLSPDYAGIRTRLNGPSEKAKDWVFQSEEEHKIPGLINLFGFESPGITSSLAIADTISNLLDGKELSTILTILKNG